jgi:hypothetical protein
MIKSITRQAALVALTLAPAFVFIAETAGYKVP